MFVASTEFVDAAAAQARSLGVDVRRVFVAHPIQDRTDPEIHALAEQAVEAVIAAVTTD